MSSWTDEYNSVFFISIATITTGFIGVVLKFCFRSKCSRFSCCGITVERDVNAELEEQRIEADQKGISTPTPSPSQKKEEEV